jgi:hypothetical protein
MKIHVFIISWSGKHEAAEAIAASCTEGDYVTVVYSNREEAKEQGSREWLQVPDAYYFGRKFFAALGHFASDADLLFLIQADAETNDWNEVLRRCRLAFSDPTVGVWAPDVHYSWWSNERVIYGNHPKGAIVAQTDGIAFAFRRSTVERLRRMDYECNNLGWGVEWAAICHARTEGRLIIRDTTLRIRHPKGSGYDHTAARTQMNEYLAQLTPTERQHFHTLVQHTLRPG